MANLSERVLYNSILSLRNAFSKSKIFTSVAVKDLNGRISL